MGCGVWEENRGQESRSEVAKARATTCLHSLYYCLQPRAQLSVTFPESASNVVSKRGAHLLGVIGLGKISFMAVDGLTWAIEE